MGSCTLGAEGKVGFQKGKHNGGTCQREATGQGMWSPGGRGQAGLRVTGAEVRSLWLKEVETVGTAHSL